MQVKTHSPEVHLAAAVGPAARVQRTRWRAGVAAPAVQVATLPAEARPAALVASGEMPSP